MDMDLYQKQIQRRKKRRAIKTLNSYKDRHETGIERKVRQILENMGVCHVPQYGLKVQMPGSVEPLYRVYDFFATGTTENGVRFDFLIECHGSYWHMENKDDKATKLQKQNIKNDKLKEAMAKKAGFPLLTLWESEIKTNPIEVMAKIEEMIEKFAKQEC